ncbi:MAG: DNA repair exonuclease [Lysinibacillus sp.]
MSTIRFFHMADLHLDSPFKGLYDLPEQALKKIRESTFEAFEKIIARAVQERPDFLLIVGDIYDGENRSLKAQRKFQTAMETLFQHNIPVILSYGNHDHLSGSWTRFALPSNVYALPKETSVVQLKIRGKQVNVYGFSYGERHIIQPMIDTYPVATDKDALHIGMLHGSVAGDTAHAVYAPFTKEQLLTKNYDYWALGHIHKRQSLHVDPPIVYPGNIQSRHRNEQGMKGYYDVTLSQGEAELTFVPTSAVVYETVFVDCGAVRHANELLKKCEEAIAVCRLANKASVVDVYLQNIDEETALLLDSSPKASWLEAIREVEESQLSLCWVQSLQIQRTINTHYEPTVATQSVLNLIEEWGTDEWKTVLKDLYQHAGGARFLEPLMDQDIQHLKTNAQALFIDEIQRA